MTNLSDKYKDSLPFESSSIVTITNNYNANSGETIFVNTASSAINVTLPASPTSGSKIKVLDVAANAQNSNITVLGNGYNISGASAYIINTPDSSVEVLYINSSKGWNILNEYISLNKPNPPLGVSASDVGTGRAYNNGAATVSFTPAVDGDPATSYTVTSTPGSITAVGTSSPITITGLQSGVSYTFKVSASNSAGTSIDSNASNSITATTVPQAPTISSVSYGFERVSVSMTPNATGGKSLTAYNATSNTLTTGTSSTSPVSVSSLTAGTAYTFTATVTNDNGTSEASSPSSSATPFTATGGSISTSGGYRIHSFTGTSTFTLTGNSISTDYLIVGAGGGGAGYYGGGGGGGGGIQNQNGITLSAGSYTATVGGGGAGTGNSLAGSGTLSSFNGITAGGGNGGKQYTQGGGASGTPQSNAGGGAYNNANNEKGGGGGGAGGIGGTPAQSNGGAAGNGGIGLSYSLSGTSTYYAGGGGGGSASQTSGGTGGLGGGGNENQNGGANTGGGGGGADQNTTGGSGGAGIVIVRYLI